jgi:hypothetical protein
VDSNNYYKKFYFLSGDGGGGDFQAAATLNSLSLNILKPLD